MITPGDKLELLAMMRREIESHARGPQFNSQQSPRGTSQSRVARLIRDRLPLTPKELDEVTLVVEGQLVPLIFYSGQWRQLGPAPLVTAMPATGRRFDGMIVHYVAESASGKIWTFRYRAAGSATYPWEFVGGSPLYEESSGSSTTASAAYADLAAGAGPNLVNPLAGDYELDFGCFSTGTTATAIQFMALKFGAAAAADADGISLQPPGVAYFCSGQPSRKIERTIATASTTVEAKYKTNAGTATFEKRWMSMRPIRVA